MASPNTKPTPLSSYVGFDTIPQQIERKLLRRGFSFNVMLVGATGLGKSTLLNTIFASHLIDSKARLRPDDPVRQTTEILPVSHNIEENGIRLKLTIIDTPGYADLLNNDHCLDPIIKYIKDQYAQYLRKELTAARDRYIVDTRVHCVLFFVNPTGHSLKPLDIVTIRQLSEICNVVPIIAKSDSLTIDERANFKQRIKDDMEFHHIKIYPSELVFMDDADDDYRQEVRLTLAIRDMIPFAIVGSERSVTLPNGKVGPGRQTKFGGIINIEDEMHCEFVHLRNFLTRTHLHDLIETTALHYEAFRTRQLLALKENRDNTISPKPT